MRAAIGARPPASRGCCAPGPGGRETFRKSMLTLASTERWALRRGNGAVPSSASEASGSPACFPQELIQPYRSFGIRPSAPGAIRCRAFLCEPSSWPFDRLCIPAPRPWAGRARDARPEPRMGQSDGGASASCGPPSMPGGPGQAPKPAQPRRRLDGPVRSRCGRTMATPRSRSARNRSARGQSRPAVASREIRERELGLRGRCCFDNRRA